MAARKVAIVLYGFPPNAGAAGTAAYLAVFESLYNMLHAMKAEGYDLTPPESVQALRDAVLSDGNDGFGQPARIAARVQRIKPSPSSAASDRANELRRQGQSIINLVVGEPDFDTPENIRRAASAAIERGELALHYLRRR